MAKSDISLTKNSAKFLEAVAQLCGHRGPVEKSQVTPADVGAKAHLKKESMAGYMTPLYNQGLLVRAERGAKRFLQLTAAGWKAVEAIKH